MAVKRYDGSQWVTVAGKGDQGTSSSIATWVKTATGGETSVSGNDDNSQPLSYTVGQELVFINGALQKRGSDYTATTGNSITGLTALAANDVVTVWTVNAFSVTNAISSGLVTTTGDIIYASAANTPARLGIGSTGQVLGVSGGVPAWATPSSSGLVLINRTSYSNVASQTFDNVFSTTYKFYTIAIEQNYAATATDDLEMIMRYGTTDATSHYSLCNYYAFNSSTLGQLTVSAGAAMKLSPDAGDASYRTSLNLTVGWVGTGSNSYPLVYGTGYGNNASHSLWFGGYPFVGGQQYTGFKLRSSSTNITGTVSVYGWSAS